MVGSTAFAEVCGHIIFSFTRSVAEHYNFDEAEHTSDLFGYNPLDDKGTEWYCQPVDEVIYQEYSNKEATSLDYLASSNIGARFVDASSTEDNETTQEPPEDRAMAWKRLRPPMWRTVWNSLLFGFVMSVLTAAVVGIVSILLFYLCYQTRLSCEGKPKESIPIKLQWISTITETVSAFVMYCWFFLNSLFFFRPFQIWGLKLKTFLLCLPFFCLDAGYRIATQALGISHSKLSATQTLPLNVLFLSCVCLQAYNFSKHFVNGPSRKLFKLFVLFAIPCMLTFVLSLFVPFGIYPFYNKQDKTGRLLIALFSPLIVVLLKGISRTCVQRLWKISHPGTSFVLLSPLYCGSAVLLRLLQVDLSRLESVALIGVIHGIAEVVERSTIALIDHIYNQVWERRLVAWGGFRTPRRERLAADIAIMSVVYEASAVISANGFLYLYQYYYTENNSPLELLLSFAATTLVPLAIEWFFTSLSFAIETRYLNIPVIAVWRKRWRRHILVAIVNSVAITLWASTSLVIAVEGRFIDVAKFHCQMPFS
ncbi:uncharacterized protein LOC110059653 [Orbicella faveolata]|uniref:uncharacterized protein LOC110059653 n=1 Tax=Orbicella faveolata TaxID=48498 RepID=UPI0009E4F3CA|nr:uncharacterized protein LOC110059653 [Orbicella faveolata]